jgi:ankyrin repeat protein
MPPGMDLKTAFHQVRDTRKPERFAILKDKIQQCATVVKDKTKKPPVRLEAAKRLNAIVSRKEFTDICPEAETKAIVASLRDLIRANYADEAICPLLIKSVGATGAVAEMASLNTERQKSKAAWVDIKSSAALQTLFTAVTNNDEASVKQLIGRGVSLNLLVPGEGHTVLHEAVAMKNLKMTRLLLDNRARTDVPGSYGTPRAHKEYPIHRAATVGDVQLVKLLLERGANPNVMDDGGYTPLHRAAALGDVAVAQVLLQGKAQPNRLDKGGRTPIDVVEQVCTSDKKHAIRDLLERSGGLTATKAVAAQTTRTTPSPVASTPRD